MDNNMSRRRSEDASCTATSVYLSFDAESTMSTACYRTLEAMTDDISVLSCLSTIEDASLNTEEKNMNSTLENIEDSSAMSPVKTVKKMQVMTTNTPLRALPKNVLKEYKALCSTPSKEQLLKTVDVTRGSDARFDDLGVAFLGVDDELPAFFPPPPPQQQRQQQFQFRCEENKENVSDGSTLSVSSSVEITTSVIERKCLTSISTAGSLTGEESVEEKKVALEMVENALFIDKSVEKMTKIRDIERELVKHFSTGELITGETAVEENNTEEFVKQFQTEEKTTDVVEENIERAPQIKTMVESSLTSFSISVNREGIQVAEDVAKNDIMEDCQNKIEKEADDRLKDDVDTTPKAKCEKSDRIETIMEDEEMPEVLTPKILKSKVIEKSQIITKLADKPKIPVFKPHSRRTICEPNLQTNKPSRISTTGHKRHSLLPVTRKMPPPPTMDIETEIPLLMNKILKISNSSMMEDETDVKQSKIETEEIKKKPSIQQPTDKRHSIMPGTTKGRSSLMPSSLGEKRPFSFTQRMSVVVKTTLNSPARKIARRSAMGTSGHLAQQQQRRSMIASTKLPQTSSRAIKAETGTRKSMITAAAPINSGKTKNPSLTTAKETGGGATQRKTLYPALTKITEVNKSKPPTATQTNPGNTLLNTQEIQFTCVSCKEKFRIKSLLDAHRRSHEGDIVTSTVKKSTTTNASAAKPSTQPPSLLSTSNKCKYCDKKFALVRALHIHLLQNCSKIPPGDKKKLQYTEMNHVGKARLPIFSHHGSNGGSSNSSTVSSTQATPRFATKQKLTQKSLDNQKRASDSSMEKDLKTKPYDTNSSSLSGSQSTIAATAAATPMGSVQKAKKATAHSGVYRTPSKTVPCHICKLTFKSILDYTNHSLATHGYKGPKDDDDY